VALVLELPERRVRQLSAAALATVGGAVATAGAAR
jgi:hypothetical protein